MHSRTLLSGLLLLVLMRPLAVEGQSPNPFAAVPAETNETACPRVLVAGALHTVQARTGARERSVPAPTLHVLGAVVLDPRGVIATSASALAEARHIAVQLGDRVLPAAVVHRDADLALLLVSSDSPLEASGPLDVLSTSGVGRSVRTIACGTHADARDRRVTAVDANGALVLDGTFDSSEIGGPVFDEHDALLGLLVRDASGPRVLPVASMRAAFDQTLPALASAHDALRADEAGLVLARVLDAATRLASGEVVAPDELVTAVQTAGLRTVEPARLALFAGFLWNASLLALERAGVATLDELPPGATRDEVVGLQSAARDLARRAQALEPAVLAGAPFLTFVAPAPTPEPVVPPSERRGWFPTFGLGYVADLANSVSNGFQIGVVFPVLLTGTRGSRVRFGFGVGGGFSFELHQDDGGWDDEEWESFDVYGLVGGTLRIGRGIGLLVQAAWAPGMRFGCASCGNEGTWNPSLLSFRFAAGPTFGRFHMSFTARVASVMEEDRYDVWWSLVAQVGVVAGLSF